MVRAVDSSDVSRWFGEYLDVFAACGRGESDTNALLGYYGVPLLVTTDGGFTAPDRCVPLSRLRAAPQAYAPSHELNHPCRSVRVK